MRDAAIARDGRGPDSNLPVVLIVGFPNSVHTARWINMIQGHGIRFVLVPAYVAPPSNTFRGTRFVSHAADLRGIPPEETPVFDLESVSSEEVAAVQSTLDYHPYRPAWLGNLQLVHPAYILAAIQRFSPVLIHSMVVQFGAYVCMACKEYLGRDFPAWLMSNWGSDIYLFRQLPDHSDLIQQIIGSIDAYHAECERDYDIVSAMGFTGFLFPALPATGGTDFESFPPLSAFARPSQRREILIKAYHGWSGRSLHILAAIHLACDALRDYRLRITLAGPDVLQMAEAIAREDGLDIVPEPYLADHKDALLRLGEARFVIGLGISDGISTTLLEAMCVGTFPVQSSCSCGDEWVTNGETGMLISPHDVQGLARVIRRVATDDDLVDRAATINRETVERRWNMSINAKSALASYEALLKEVRQRRVDRHSGYEA